MSLAFEREDKMEGTCLCSQSYDFISKARVHEMLQRHPCIGIDGNEDLSDVIINQAYILEKPYWMLIISRHLTYLIVRCWVTLYPKIQMTRSPWVTSNIIWQFAKNFRFCNHATKAATQSSYSKTSNIQSYELVIMPVNVSKRMICRNISQTALNIHP